MTRDHRVNNARREAEEQTPLRKPEGRNVGSNGIEAWLTTSGRGNTKDNDAHEPTSVAKSSTRVGTDDENKKEAETPKTERASRYVSGMDANGTKEVMPRVGKYTRPTLETASEFEANQSPPCRIAKRNRTTGWTQKMPIYSNQRRQKPHEQGNLQITRRTAKFGKVDDDKRNQMLHDPPIDQRLARKGS
ncbi:hypothetical protein R1flu_028513 [Riccia fluitans]|uniref:Uncharacterized protein n=1 Tax=Riccia fluitans TaxID=41844 RepID=A0ABD1XMF6_9MARC